MAELIRPRVDDPAGPASGTDPVPGTVPGDGSVPGDASARPGHASAPPATDPVPEPAPDLRAVRVRLATASRQGDEPMIRLSPEPEPLRMANPTIGAGPLGGLAPADPEPGDGELDGAPGAPVLAQRRAVVDGVVTVLSLDAMGHGRHVLDEAGTRTRVVLEPEQGTANGVRRREVLVGGFRLEVEVEAERIAALRERATRGRATGAHGGPLDIRAIIPGKVVAISVTPGDAVTAGQQLLVVEAMKMQNELRAPRDGTIERVGVAPGVNIEVGDLLVVIS